MALNPATAAQEIITAIEAVTDKSDRLAVFTALTTALFAHIAANGVVAVASVSGVTVGVGVSGPGAGTIT